MLKRLTRRRQSLIRLVITVCIAANVMGVLVLAGVPPVSRDALNHHLAVPKLYLERGGLVEIPDCPYSYYPMNLDLLYLIPLYFGHDIVAKYIHFTFALATALLIFVYLRRKTDTTYALLGVLGFLSIPVIIKLSITVYVDLGLVFFSTAALLFLLRWAETKFAPRYLILSAVFCGLALGTKYNALITVFLLTLFVPVIYLRKNRASGGQLRAVGYGAVYLLIALLIFSPWMARNYLWKGNPIYPLYESLFTPDDEPSSPMPGAVLPERNTKPAEGPGAGDTRDALPWGHFAYRHAVFGESGWEIALIPLRVFFQGKDDTPQYFDGVLNPGLLFLPFLAFVTIRRDNAFLRLEKSVFAAFAFGFLLFVFVREDMRIRWIAPIIPPLVILSVFGIQAFFRIVNKNAGRVLRPCAKAGGLLVLGALFFLNIAYMAEQFVKVAPLTYISGKVTRDDYISRFRPAYRLHEYAGRYLPHDAIILGLFMGNRRYYSRRQMIFDAAFFKELVCRYDSAQTVADALGARGITHLMLRQDLFERWATDNFNPAQLSNIEALFSNHLTPLVTGGGYGLYQLK